MHVLSTRDDFHLAVQTILGVVDPRHIKPVLQDIRVRTVGEELELAATDLEVGMKYHFQPKSIKEQGGIVLPAARLAAVVRESTDEELTFEATEESSHIHGRDSNFNINGQKVEEFPEVPDFGEAKPLKINGAAAKEMIRKTLIAVAVEKLHYALNGVFLRTKKGSTKIEMVSTDGRRLSHIQRKANAASPFDASVIIPTKALIQVDRMLSEEVVEIEWLADEKQFMARTEKALLVSQLVEGRFPEYENVIPKGNDKKMELMREEFASAVRRAALLSSEEARAVQLAFEKGKMVLTSHEPEAGDARVEMPLKYDDDPFAISFNADYILDALKVTDEETVHLELKDSGSACLLRCGQGFIYVVMPITED